MKRFALLIVVLIIVLMPIITVAATEIGFDSTMIVADAEGETDAIAEVTSTPEVAMTDPGVAPNILDSITNFLNLFARLLPWILVLTVVFIALWVYFDASRRTNYGWVWGIASLLIIPWIIYLLWRPILTTEEQKILESDSRLRKIESDYYQYVLSKEKHICPVCGTPISDDYQVCPNCFKQLKMICPNCNRLLETEWKVCPFCTTRVRKQDE